jgi:hypothetical protein
MKYVIYVILNPLPEKFFSRSGFSIAYNKYFRKWIKHNIHKIFQEVDSV